MLYRQLFTFGIKMSVSIQIDYILNNISDLFFTYFREMYENALKANDKITAISYDLLESQIWSLLASFCSNPSDISTSFRVRYT